MKIVLHPVGWIWGSPTSTWKDSMGLILRTPSQHLGLFIVLFRLEYLAVHQHGEDQTEYLHNKNTDAEDPDRRNVTSDPSLHFLIAGIFPPGDGVTLARSALFHTAGVGHQRAIPHLQPISVVLHSAASELSLYDVPRIGQTKVPLRLIER